MVAQNEATYIDVQSIRPHKDKLSNGNMCFTKQRPLIIQTVKGQKLKLTFKNLKLPNAIEHSSHTVKSCMNELGFIVGGGQKTLPNVTICSNAFKVQVDESTHFSKLFETKDNHLKLCFSQPGQSFDFLIGVEGSLYVLLIESNVYFALSS